MWTFTHTVWSFTHTVWTFTHTMWTWHSLCKLIHTLCNLLHIMCKFACNNWYFEVFILFWPCKGFDKSVCFMGWKFLLGSRSFPDGLESLDVVWKVSYCSGKFPDGPESFQTSLKVSRRPGMSLIVLESSQTARKASNWSWVVQMAWRVCRRSWKPRDGLESFYVARKFALHLQPTRSKNRAFQLALLFC